ncbi:MAG: sigma-70 family RNA polymerase sigma factor [Lactobacillales bacterium]|nr:sigma-70 family RNA polymerase sigma factor [Lactobacillales bacterium]
MELKLEEYILNNVINKIKKTDSTGKTYLLESDLKKLKLTPSETIFLNLVLNKHKISIYETTKDERSDLVRNFEYGKMETLQTKSTDKPTMSELEYENEQLVFADFTELEEYLIDEFIPENVHMVTVRSKNKEPYPSIQLNKLVKLKLNEEEMKHALEVLKEQEIIVRGMSQDMEEFENYDYVSTYHYTMLPETLPWDQQYNLFLAYQKTKDPIIKEKLILSNLRLVPYVAYRMHKITGYPKDELESVGYAALIPTVEKFNVLTGFKFSSYAFKCLKGHMLNEINQNQRFNIPIAVRDNIRRAIRVVEQDYGTKFSVKEADMFEDVIELLEKLGVIRSESAKYQYIRLINAMEEKVEMDDIEIVSSENLEENAMYELLRQDVKNVVNTLTTKEQTVINLRFGLEDGKTRTLEEIGKMLKVSRERIRQIEAKALRKLRHPARSSQIKGYCYLDLSNGNEGSVIEIKKDIVDVDKDYNGRTI